MNLPLPPFALVGVGGAAGALARHLVGHLVAGYRATLTVNVLGSVALGGVVAAGTVAGDATALAVGTGFCGAFTTFSSFAVGVVELASDGRREVAAQFAVTNLVGAVLGVVLGTAVVVALS